MEWPLILAGLAMGVAATPHCVVMCGAPCSALTQGCARDAAGFHLGRIAGYMAAGAVAASSVATLGVWAQSSPALRPLWTMLHLAFLALGLWWLATGRQPNWMRRTAAVPVTVHVVGRRARPLRSGLAGLAWVAWPCAALQGALLLAALASSALGGALVMGGFALASMPALAAAPWAWAMWHKRRGVGGRAGQRVAPGQIAVLGFRVAGGGLVVVSGWALTHGIWERVAAWCAG